MPEIGAEKRLAAILVTHDPVKAVTLADRIIVRGARPAGTVADLSCDQQPCDTADAYRAAAGLRRRPDVARAFADCPPDPSA